MHIKSKILENPSHFLVKRLGSPSLPRSEVRVEVIHEEFIIFPEHKPSALICEP